MSYIVKSEKCLACHSRADSWEEDDEIVIVCANEFDMEEKDSGSCLMFLAIAGKETEAITDDEKEEEMPKKPDNIEIEEVRTYIFANNMLVETTDKAQVSKAWTLRPSFVEKYNAMIQMLEDVAAEQIEVIEQELIADLLATRLNFEDIYVNDSDTFNDIEDVGEMLMLVGPAEDEEDEDFIDEEDDGKDDFDEEDPNDVVDGFGD